MKRVLSLLLVLTMILGTMVVAQVTPAFAEEEVVELNDFDKSAPKIPFTTKYVGTETLETYSGGTKNSTSYYVRVYFVNGSSKYSVTKYKVSFKFYDVNGAYLSSKSTGWVKKTVKAKKGAWSSYVTFPSGAYSFSYSVYYYSCGRSGSTKGIIPECFLTTSSTNAAGKSVAVIPESEDDSTTKGGIVYLGKKWQFKYTYTYYATDGSLKSKNEYVRAYVTNSTTRSIYKYKFKYNCYDTNSNFLATVSTGTKRLTIKRGKSAWSTWVSVPFGTVTTSFNYSKVYFR